MSNSTGETTCNSNPDDHSTIDFGDLSNGDPPVGFNCWWANSNHITQETDIRINVVDYEWTPNVGRTCTQKYDLQSVVTHEMAILGVSTTSIHMTIDILRCMDDPLSVSNLPER